MRHSASEKMEVIRIVGESDLSVRRTLELLGIPRTTFYRWHRRYELGGFDALKDRKPRPPQAWNQISQHNSDNVLSRAWTNENSYNFAHGITVCVLSHPAVNYYQQIHH